MVLSLNANFMGIRRSCPYSFVRELLPSVYKATVIIKVEALPSLSNVLQLSHWTETGDLK